MADPRVAAIVGPTAVGKTAVSLEVAEALGAEIVSIDSMQVYRGMDIGTAKVDAEARDRVAHHLIDIRPPNHDVTVAGFQRLAREAIADIHQRGRLPLLVGGSGLYLRAVVDDLEFPARSEEVRAAIEAEVEEMGAEALHTRLAALDPAAAERIEPRNARRTVRALEVIELTGRPFSESSSWESYSSIYPLRVAGLSLEREVLYEAIAARVDGMLSQGLIEEARTLGPDLGRTARQALGYRQVLDTLEASEQELREAIVRATKRFARRQESWFRSDPRIRWFDARDPALVPSLVAYFAGGSD